MIEISKLQLDVSMQARAAIDTGVVQSYAEHIAQGGTFPPIKVFFDKQEKKYWLADGWHRVLAHQKIGSEQINEDIEPGTRRDAILYALGCNATHGLRRTNADKRRAVEIVLADPEWSQWSDRVISERCAVSNVFVSAIRKELLTVNSSTEKRTGKDGKARKQPNAKKAKDLKPKLAVVVPEEVADYGDRDQELDSLRDQVTSLNEQNDELRDAVAKAVAPEGMDAESLIAELRAKVKTLTATVSALEARRDTLMNENAQLKRTVEYWRKRAGAA